MHADADAATAAIVFAAHATRRKAVPIGDLQSHVEHTFEIASVVGVPARRPVRHRRGRDQVAAADCHRIDLHFPRRLVDQPLHHIGRFGSTRPPVGPKQWGIGEHRTRCRVDQRHVVDARQVCRCDHGRRTRGVAEISADIDDELRPQRQDAAVAAERDLAGGSQIPAVHVRQEAFAAVSRPLDRAADLACGPDNKRVFRIDRSLHAEPAADIGRHNAEVGFGYVQHLIGDHVAGAIGSLRCDVESVSVLKPVEDADGRAWLQRTGGRARIAHFKSADVRRARERCIDRGAIALFEAEANVAFRLIPDERGSVTQRILRVRRRWRSS